MNENLENIIANSIKHKTKINYAIGKETICLEISSPPKGLMQCDPSQRIFPISWKETYFRMNFNEDIGGYICPVCQQIFCGSEGFSQLRSDHIYPFSKGGLTVWDNLQLLCIRCNSKKSDKLKN